MGALFLSQAGITGAVKNDVMIFDPKSRRRHRFNTGKTSFQFKDSAAHEAKKVMMMALVRTFVTRRLAGNFHRDDAPLVRQRFEGSVNGCQSDRRNFLQG